MSETSSHLLIYDRSNNDSLVCAAVQKYYIKQQQEYAEDEIIALNWDEIPYDANTNPNTISKQCKTISLCAAIIDPNIIRIMYSAIHEKFLSIQFNPKYKDIVASTNSNIVQLFQQRTQESELAERVILNVGQSASLTLFKYLYGDNIPYFFMYLDAFVTDSYYEYNDLTRDDVIKFDKGLSLIYENNFDKIFEFINDNNGPTNIPNELTVSISDAGQDSYDNTNNYIINHYKKYGGVVFECDYKGGIVRKVLPMFTCERLSTAILLNPIFDVYDSIVTFNQLKTGKWEMCLYNIIHDDGIENPEDPTSYENLTIEQRRIIKLNTFSAGIYIKNLYNGMGNDIYGKTTINTAQLCRILSLKEL